MSETTAFYRNKTDEELKEYANRLGELGDFIQLSILCEELRLRVVFWKSHALAFEAELKAIKAVLDNSTHLILKSKTTNDA